MQAFLFCGTEGRGKAIFYRKQFFHSHVRISLELTGTSSGGLVYRFAGQPKAPALAAGLPETANISVGLKSLSGTVVKGAIALCWHAFQKLDLNLLVQVT